MSQIKCGPGNKACGKRCIPQKHKCALRGEKDAEEMKPDKAKKQEDPRKQKKEKAAPEEKPEKKKGSKLKTAAIVGASVLGAAGVAFVAAGVATGKVKLPGQDQAVSAFQTTKGVVTDPEQRKAAIQQGRQQLSTMTQTVSEQASAQYGKVSEGFKGIQKAIQNPGQTINATFSNSTLENMGQTIALGSKSALEGVSSSVKGSATIMAAAGKDLFEKAGADMKAVSEATTNSIRGAGDDMKQYWATMKDASPSEMKAATLDLAGKYMEGGREGAKAFMQGAGASAKGAGETLGAAGSLIKGEMAAGAQKVGESAAFMKEGLSSYAPELKDQVVGAAQGAKDMAGNAVQGAKNMAGNAVQGAQNAAGSAVQGVKDAAGATVSEAQRVGGELGAFAKDVGAAGQAIGDATNQAARQAGAAVTRAGTDVASRTGASFENAAGNIASSAEQNMQAVDIAREELGNNIRGALDAPDAAASEKLVSQANDLYGNAQAEAGKNIVNTATENAKAFMGDFKGAVEDNMTEMVQKLTGAGQTWQTAVASAFGSLNSMHGDGASGIGGEIDDPWD
jgi:hypothetical protein